ncbi:MAG: winged helix-turn-helix domain-containing protein [Chloroflexi bacterium]|nr:winged helix-turn-helix domain-containing protein [Chloroflexota bacterium]
MKKYIQRLRSKLGDDARHPTWIRTIRGVGYRLVSPN